MKFVQTTLSLSLSLTRTDTRTSASFSNLHFPYRLAFLSLSLSLQCSVDHTFMSHPTKRLPSSRPNSSSAAASSSSSSSSLSAAAIGPPMKKSKSQAVACSLDPNKNGLHHHHHHHNHSQDGNDVVFDPSAMSLDEDLKPSDGPSFAANLSRKKATPPQPSGKKFVIKLNKGDRFFDSIPLNFFFGLFGIRL